MRSSSLFAKCFVLFALVATLSVTATAQISSGSNALLGSWKVRLSPENGDPPFDELMTFTDGGGIVESNNYPFYLTGITAGPGQGTWSYSGKQRFSFTFLKILTVTSGPGVGILKVAGTITYSAVDDSWSGPATVSVCNNLLASCTVQGVTNGSATRVMAGQ